MEVGVQGSGYKARREEGRRQAEAGGPETEDGGPKTEDSQGQRMAARSVGASGNGGRAANGETAAGRRGEGEEPADGAPLWVRFNDYGIGLLLQGETRGAVRAFKRVVDLAPGRVDGYRNLARAAVRDGNVPEAYRHLERCEAIAPGDPQTAWVWGTAHQRAGRYEEAGKAYERVLQAFPEDRAAWRNLGRVRYLYGEFEHALEALDQVLAIDPEDRAAHYHRMLSLRALGRREEAAAAERAYEKYQIDESARKVVREFLLDHPAVERATQRIQVHEVEPWTPSGARLAETD